jgi:predicted DNA-binding transcriptional regulator YafY
MYLDDHKHYYGFVSETISDNHIEMTFLTETPDNYMARWILMFADKTEIIEPESLKDRIALLMENIVQKHSLSINLLT